jgi:hypothetical protein
VEDSIRGKIAALNGACYILASSMGSLLFFVFSWWGFLLQGIAIVHFIRRRPDTYWLFIIFIGGWLGALVYIAVSNSGCRFCAC